MSNNRSLFSTSSC